MLGRYFSFDPLDNDLEKWLSDKIGVEVFSPKEGRLQKHFLSFKEIFTEKNIPIITIAGTNGKGEVALLLEDQFLQNQWSPFLWSSPHTLSVRERFSFEGKPIEAKQLFSLFEKHSLLAKELSFYEFLFYCFNEWVTSLLDSVEKPIIIFEVGLGGRLDATNFFDAWMAVLVSIGRDHMEILGPTLNDVLQEKVEIVREGKPCVSAVSQKHLREKLQKICMEKGVELSLLENLPDEKHKESFKERNRRLAKLSFETFGNEYNLKMSAVEFPQMTWARPFKVTYKTTQFILVGSHNLDGLRQLATWVNEENIKLGLDCSFYSELWVGMSRRPGSDLDQCLRLIQESPCLGQEVVLFDFNHPRATPLKELKDSWLRQGQGRKVRFEKSWDQYLHQDHSHKNILVCGSYYFIGELLREGPLKPHLVFH